MPVDKELAVKRARERAWKAAEKVCLGHIERSTAAPAAGAAQGVCWVHTVEGYMDCLGGMWGAWGGMGAGPRGMSVCA